ncbi:hypothetical protein BK010_00490 [Tenericutes bacterium MO-XQ]|nr:hypothetical protein BK010_00490 [Tenericutes bacterium MO-XQ]
MRRLSNDEGKVLDNITKLLGEKVPTAIYARKSSKDLSKESLDTQINICKNFIKGNKNHLKLIKVYQEDETSGMVIKKTDEFQKMIEAVEEGFIKVIIASRWDRFRRDKLDIAKIKELFKKYGVMLIIVEDSGEKSALSLLQTEMVTSFNQFYVQKIAEDTKAVLINKTSKGRTGGGVPNYGYQVNEDKFLVKKIEEAVVVAEIYDKFELGYSYNDIIEDLKARNIKTRKGNDFSKSTIHDILTNVKYMGVYRYNRQDRIQSNFVVKHFDEVWVEEGIKEPIISKKQFEEVQKLMELRQLSHKNTDYLLSGIMECEVCGSKMVGSSQSAGKGKPRRKHYICPKHEKRNGGTCSNKGIDASTIENQVKQNVLDAVNTYIKTDLFDISVFKEAFESKKRLVKSINKSIDHAKTSKRNTLDRLIDPNTRDEIKKELQDRVSEINEEIKDLENRKKFAEDSIKQHQMLAKKQKIQDIEATKLFGNEPIVKRLVKVIVNQVKIGKEDIQIKILEK